MHVFSLENREILLGHLEKELQRRLGVKASALKIKKAKKRHSTLKTRIFQRPLEALPKQPILLKSGGVVDVPCFVVDLCQEIGKHLDTEGIFRKAGSSTRQKEIKTHFEAGGTVQENFHEVDLANVLKHFLRELPEPLISPAFQDVLSKAQKQSNEFMILLCTLLPASHLHLLAFLTEFLLDVASFSKCNLMPASNLAIVLSPSFMPISEHRHDKLTNHALQHDNNIRILEVLINESKDIGEIPMALGYQLGLIDDEKSDEVASNASMDSVSSKTKPRKRRSGSLTKMFNGIRKIVGGGGARPPSPTETETPCKAVHTPVIKSTKKRKADTPAPVAMSAKMKLDVLHSIPDGVLLSSTPFKPVSMKPMPSDTPAKSHLTITPILKPKSPPKPVKKSPHPQGIKVKQKSRFFTPRSKSESILQRVMGQPELKKPRLSFGSKKTSKKQLVKAPNLSPPKSEVEPKVEPAPPVSRTLRRKKSWSSLSGSLGRNMRRLAPITFSDTPLLSSPYAPRLRGKIPEGLGGATAMVDLSPALNLQSQYDEIKNKVASLESQLNQVLSQAQQQQQPEEMDTNGHTASFVQTEYEKTIEDAEPFNTCQTTDQLAKRLSRELKIRRSAENRIIRSPSARKIGTLRRRSKETGRIVKTNSSTRLSRSPQRSVTGTGQTSRSLQRGRPNSITSGLTQPSPGQLQRQNAPSESNLCSAVASSSTSQQVSTPVVTEKVAWPTAEQTKSPKFAIPMSSVRGMSTRSAVRKASSFHAPESPMSHLHVRKTPSFRNASSQDESWLDAKSFLSHNTPSKLDSVGRPSIAEIKNKRAGMVLASVKLFETSPVEEKRKGGAKSKDTSPLISPKSKSPKKRLSAGWKPTNTVTPERRRSANFPRRSVTQEKENVSSPCDTLKAIKTQFSPKMELPMCLKETIYDVCTPKVPQVKSPLAAVDVNKINPSTPKQCPTIKRPLSVRPVAASAFKRTPYQSYATPCGATPVSVRRSPRLNGVALTFS
ncbi:uncharacterized protein LOC135943673 [Cloeon dipterum]|uniref:uncharacterized protein LOC135943673 n=1 Tax=Cloeon dipterum TaxID=197152 RepID=UPI00322035DD